MGVEILALKEEADRILRIGGSRHIVGILARLWKVTETDLVDDRADRLDAIDDSERRAEATPKAVIVESATLFSPPCLVSAAHRVLGWDRGRHRTQDLDHDHLPTLGFAVEDADGEFVLHEVVGNSLAAMTDARARELGILSADGQLLRRGQPTIVACSSVESTVGGYYAAECEFDDGRRATVLGESESGKPPEPAWFVGKNPDVASSYRLAHQIAQGR